MFQETQANTLLAKYNQAAIRKTIFVILKTAETAKLPLEQKILRLTTIFYFGSSCGYIAAEGGLHYRIHAHGSFIPGNMNNCSSEDGVALTGRATVGTLGIYLGCGATYSLCCSYLC